MTQEEAANRPRLVPGSSRGHVESYFLKANDPATDRAFWLKFTFLSPDGKPEEALAETWAVVFDRRSGRHRAAKESRSLSGARSSADPFRVEIGESVLETGHTAGRIEAGGGPVRWDLRFTTTSSAHLPFPLPAMYEAPLPRFKVLSPYPDEVFDGWIAVGDDRIEVAGWPGMQGHNWGREHTWRYAWAHANVLGAPHAFFEGMSARVKVGPVKTPWLSLATLAFDGRRVHFDDLAAFVRTRTEVDRMPRVAGSGSAPGWGWRFRFRSKAGTLAGEIAADRDEMVGLTYANPEGAPTNCLNSKTARLVLTFDEPGAAPRRFSSEHAALEIGTKRTDHGIRMVL